MAYVLGFFAADGNMLVNKRGAHFIEFPSTDKEIVYKIRDALKSNLIVSEYQPKDKNNRRRYRLQIGSKEIYNDLLKFGMMPRKSKLMGFPSIPDEYLSHFVRGYFDGDGNVTVTTYVRKNRNNKLTTTILSGFISGSKNFLEGLFLKLKEVANISSGSLYYYGRGYRLYFSVRGSLALYGFMYKNSDNFYLPRKKKIFEKYFKID